ncbi:MAG TPA: class I SAM-dependent methyltransferase, partial [Patescibacteria group bacterium]|nr:class I SAM-dependent methyltransferase [Patescibacteria group bacterium]
MTQNCFKKRNNCRGCGSKKLFKFLDLGKMPLAGGFISKDKKIEKEIKVPLDVHFCQDCGLVQILTVINPDVLFQDYCYVSSVIKSLSKHFEGYSQFLLNSYLKKTDSKILEFGCNDGVLLQYLKKRRAFGIDPSKNVSRIAKKKGFDVRTGYFDQRTAVKILKDIGKMDVVTGSNVFAHVDDIHEIIKAAKVILKPDGVFIIEVHYLKDLLDKFQYDTIYHEHLCYYSIKALKKIFSLNGMRIIDVIHLEMHGGGIRVVAANNASRLQEKKSVSHFLTDEKNINKKKLQSFGKFCINHKKKLNSLLKNIKKKNQTIVGYGAPGRGTILLNYCKIGK